MLNEAVDFSQRLVAGRKRNNHKPYSDNFKADKKIIELLEQKILLKQLKKAIRLKKQK